MGEKVMEFKIAELGSNVETVCKNENCIIYQLKDNSGEGMMTLYQLFAGVYIMFNDFHMESCMSQFRQSSNMLCIDHCQEGRIEWQLDKNKYIYLKEGDMQLSTRKYHSGRFSFPLKHYHGITICFNIPEAEVSLSRVLDGFCPELEKLKEKFCCHDENFVMRAGAGIQHIFSELYNVGAPLRLHYCQIKVLELLIFLKGQEVAVDNRDRPYFYKGQVEKVKAMAALLTEDLEKHYTLEELSDRFEIPLTTMKQCFKGVYGSSVYAYVKAYRMNTAAFLLRTTEETVAGIAGKMGYDNASKFAAAFKETLGDTPLAYRKSFV
jgi:AraC-like DNA-binding protein